MSTKVSLNLYILGWKRCESPRHNEQNPCCMESNALRAGVIRKKFLGLFARKEAKADNAYGPSAGLSSRVLVLKGS